MTKEKSTDPQQKAATANPNIVRAQLKVGNAHKKGLLPYQKGGLAGGKGIHVGYTTGRLLQKMKLTNGNLAALLGITPESVRRMLKKKYLHAATLVKISQALQHDVVRYLYLPENLPGNRALEEKVKDLEAENAALKEKVEMLSELNRLLRKAK